MNRKNRKQKFKTKNAVNKNQQQQKVNSKSGPRGGTVRNYRVLWANSSCLLDTSSGASISIRQILKQLQKSGYDLRIVGATIFDSPHGTKGLGQEWQDVNTLDVKIVDVKDGNLSHRLVRTQSIKRSEMSLSESDFLYSTYINEINEFKPDIVFFYGGLPLDFLISHEARVRGIPSAAYLVNANYKGTRWCRDVDLIITDTHATSAMYAAREGFTPVPVGKFIDPGRVISTQHSRRHATLINPSWAKGAGIVAMLAVLLEESRPDIVFEVVESRGSWSEVVRNVTRSVWGVERSELSNVIVTPNTDNISEVYGRSRIVLGLSQWWESGSRVLAEAMLNGIPAMVSNQGGSPEMVGEGGIVVDLPPSCHEAPYNSMPRPELLEELVQFLERVWDDEPFYLNLMVRALQQGNKLHRMEVSTQRLLEAFQLLVEKRAGDGDFSDAVKKVHKHGLSESDSYRNKLVLEVNSAKKGSTSKDDSERRYRNLQPILIKKFFERSDQYKGYTDQSGWTKINRVNFFWSGKSTEMPALFVNNLRALDWPELEICQLTDHQTNEVEGVDQVIRNNLPDELMLARMISYQQAPKVDGVQAFLDVDTVCFQRFRLPAELEKKHVLIERQDDFYLNNKWPEWYPEFTGKKAKELMPFIGGCIFSYDPNEIFTDALEIYHALPQRFHRWYGDQIALNVYFKANEEKCAIVPEDIYLLSIDNSLTPNEIRKMMWSGVQVAHFKGAEEKMFHKVCVENAISVIVNSRMLERSEK
jgi:glycosyltransferase involved in cell wall biosynthesis